MFVNKNRLPHVLSPRLYSCPEQYELEIQKLFRPSWHIVGSVADAPKDGDFFTIDLLGTPLLVRNFQGIYHTFLNVCPHRHCMLTHEPSGHSPVLTCQYHGWEFNDDGSTGRIPQAQNFRPMPGDRSACRSFEPRFGGH